MPPMIPAQPILELPYVVIEALGRLRGAYAVHRCVAEAERKQTVQTSRVAVPDAQLVAELPDVGCPTVTAVQRDMAPTNAGIIHPVVSYRPSPVANGVV